MMRCRRRRLAPAGSTSLVLTVGLAAGWAAAKPTREFDADWGGGFLQPDAWVGSSTTR